MQEEVSHFNPYLGPSECFWMCFRLLGGRDKWVKMTGVHCFRAVNQPCHLATCWQSHLQVLTSLMDQVQLINYALGVLFLVRWRVLFVQQIPFLRALWTSNVAWFGWGSKGHSNQMSWFMHGPQSWGIRVVCLIWVQKCVDLAHSIRLELESLENSLFTTPHLQNGWIDHLTPW